MKRMKVSRDDRQSLQREATIIGHWRPCGGNSPESRGRRISGSGGGSSRALAAAAAAAAAAVAAHFGYAIANTGRRSAKSLPGRPRGHFFDHQYCTCMCMHACNNMA